MRIPRRMLSLLMLLCWMAGINALAEDLFSDFTTITVDGVEYKPKQNVVSYLVMGIDRDGTVDREKAAADPGRCDAIYLLVIDKAADTFAIININRDTVTQVHSLSPTGEDLAVTPIQIALAHENGDGMEMSCRNTVQAVSDLLMGVTIDHYAAVNIEGIKVINHSVGGVDVLIEDDFGEEHPDLVQGKIVHLDDDQAYLFVRSRKNTGDGTNAGRLRRQQQYIEAIKPLLKENYQKNASFPLKLAHSLESYMVTDMTDKDYSYIAKALLQNEDLGILTIEGETAVDEMGWVAFYPDEDSIRELVLRLFYTPVQPSFSFSF